MASEFERATKALFSKFTHHEFSTYSFLQLLLGVKAKSLISKHLKWCPICLNEWRRNKLDVYFPLYWLASDASVCLKHRVHLLDQCPSCSKEPSTITSLSIQGYCDHCGEWLGKTSLINITAGDAAFWKTCFDTECNRSEQGTMNQMKGDIEHMLWFENAKLEDLSPYRVAAWLADRPCTIKGQKDYVWPIQAMAELLGGTIEPMQGIKHIQTVESGAGAEIIELDRFRK